MARLYISEYDSLGYDPMGVAAPMGREPALRTSVVVFGVTTQSVVFGQRTRFVRIIADENAWLVFGDNPSATVASTFVPANSAEYFAVNAGQRLAAYDGES